MSVDLYNFAYPEDPIVAGLIMDSGTALLPQGPEDKIHSNFTFVAQQLGCKNQSAAAELTCMRNVPFQKVEDFLMGYDDNGTLPTISFSPLVDNKTFFANYTERGLAGDFTKKVS